MEREGEVKNDKTSASFQKAVVSSAHHPVHHGSRNTSYKTHNQAVFLHNAISKDDGVESFNGDHGVSVSQLCVGAEVF